MSYTPSSPEDVVLDVLKHAFKVSLNAMVDWCVRATGEGLTRGFYGFGWSSLVSDGKSVVRYSAICTRALNPSVARVLRDVTYKQCFERAVFTRGCTRLEWAGSQVSRACWDLVADLWSKHSFSQLLLSPINVDSKLQVRARYYEDLQCLCYLLRFVYHPLPFKTGVIIMPHLVFPDGRVKQVRFRASSACSRKLLRPTSWAINVMDKMFYAMGGTSGMRNE